MIKFQWLLSKSRKKTLFEEHVIYGKRTCSESYEDRRYKHLYEKNHLCRESRVCRKFCQKKLCEAGKYNNESVNYKQDDIFQLENEEMSFDNANVNYHKLSEFYGQRNATDFKLRFNSYTTLILPPLPDEIKAMGVRVYVTDLNADFSCDAITPFSIQDLISVNHDVDGYQV